MPRTEISNEASTWLLQAKEILDEARRLKPGPERKELRQTAKVLREIAKREAASGSAPERDRWPRT
ncbi:hypothetical protein [Bradyrhizobium paxllaeri]|uniref:hypothetical protein n=1 Tax=Bradyrhizobium paxllaeri TaxID=190148 RepID=UPI000810B391|nr:hypothetical protein [Bradyrhizobium paxllaeri]